MRSLRVGLTAALVFALAAFRGGTGRRRGDHPHRLHGPAHRHLRPGRQGHARRPQDGARAGQLPGGRAQDRADRGGHRGQLGHRHREVPQAGGPRQDPRDDRHPAGQRGQQPGAADRARPAPHPVPHHPGRPHQAQGRQVDPPLQLLGEPDHAPAGRLRGPDAQVPPRGHHRDGQRLRPRGGGRLPARLRGRAAARWSRRSGCRSTRSTSRRISRRWPRTWTRSARSSWPARRCAS